MCSETKTFGARPTEIFTFAFYTNTFLAARVLWHNWVWPENIGRIGREMIKTKHMRDFFELNLAWKTRRMLKANPGNERNNCITRRVQVVKSISVLCFTNSLIWQNQSDYACCYAIKWFRRVHLLVCYSQIANYCWNYFHSAAHEAAKK